MIEGRAPYPENPGFKRNGPSRDAAFEMDARAPTLRTQVLCLIAEGPRTADECAEALGKTVLAIRPRLSELLKDDLIHDTGERRENVSGVMATVWGNGRRPKPNTTSSEGQHDRTRAQ